MATDYARIDAYVKQHMDGWMEELSRLCAQPSVSARHEGIVECADIVADLLRARGFATEVLATDGGHPIVLATAAGANPNRHLLFYNHYDVQPPEPLEDWETPPFEPSIRDGRLYARGAKDDKGEFVSRLAALDAVKAETGGYPCRVTFLVEGEEEVGSPHLPAWVARHADRLRVDGAIWEEGGIDFDGAPRLSLGARGLLYVELTVRTLARDGHSGGANLLPNANWRLTWALASLKAPDEQILIPGFYDAVRPPTAREEQLLELLPSQEESVKQQFEIKGLLGGLTGAAVTRAPWTPTCNIAGMGGGYQGPGSKTIVPAIAAAKIDFRLVPDQDPHDILARLRAHLDAGGFDDVEIEVMGAEYPGITDADAGLVRLAAETAEQVYGRPARLVPLNGGTTPKFIFTRDGVPVIAPGVGYDGNRVHSPNEHVRLEDFERAAQHMARLAIRFAE